MSALHPLLRELQTTNLRRPTTRDMDRIFRAAAEGGVTPAERQLLQSTFRQHADGWTATARRNWEQRLAAAPRGAIHVRPQPHGPEAEDLAAPMRTVWMQGIGDGVQEHFIAEMAKLGADLGFRLKVQLPAWASVAGFAQGLLRTTGLPLAELDRVVDVVRTNADPSVWGEDNKILTNGDDVNAPVKVLVPPRVSGATFDKAEAFTASEGYHPYREGFQGAVSDRGEDQAAIELAARLGREAQRTRTYIEGGNLLPGVTSDGRPYAMVGRDSLVISAFHLDQQRAFSNAQVDAKVRELRGAGKLTPQLVEETAAQLHRVEQWTSWRAPAQVTAAHRAEAPRFLAKLELTKEIAARDLGLPADRLISLTQPEFHIDMHMRPLAPGEVIVHHPGKSIEVIDQALADPRTPAWERSELQSMRRNAVLEQREMGHVYDQIFAELAEAGLIAIEAPGVFMSHNRDANFMNGIPGTTERGQTYYLTNSSSLTSLERAFQRFVQDLGVERVEFLGSAYGGPRSLSVSEYSLSMAGGLDCRTVDHGADVPPKDDLTRALRGLV